MVYKSKKNRKELVQYGGMPTADVDNVYDKFILDKKEDKMNYYLNFNLFLLEVYLYYNVL